MKKYWLFLWMILFPLLFISCSDDDKDNDFKNIGTLTIDGTSYELSQGVIYKREQWEPTQGFNFDVDLASSDFNIEDLENPTGIGEFVALEMFCESTVNLSDGSYNVDATEVFPVGTFCGILATGFNVATEEGSEFYIIRSGTAVVNKSGDLYEFTITVLADLLDEYLEDVVVANVPVSVYYKGTLKKEDF